MSRTKVLENVKLTSFDDLFGGKNIEKAAEAGDVKEIPLSELHEFHNHPFQIRSDEELAEMIESVREHGVLVPGIVRRRKEGGYEIIAGHTRKHVCEILGFETMPVFVKEMDDDEASLVMVDSNIQRENIRPSERAKAYKIKYDAMKNQGKVGNSLKMMSEESGENYKLIQRYIWLARLNDDLLALVDNKQLGMVQGVSLSVLPEKEQEAVYDALCRNKMKLSTVQANTIKRLSVDGKFNEQILERYLTSAQKQKRKKEITLKNARLSEYFGEETTEEEMMNIIFICTGMSQNLIDAQRNRSTKTMVSNSEFMLLLDQGTMDKEAVEDLFDISSEQLACVNGAEPRMGLIRFGDKIVPFDNTMEKDSSLYQLFNTNFHEMVNKK